MPDSYYAEKFHGILTDLGKKQVVDIMKTRYEHDLCDYFKKHDRSGSYFLKEQLYAILSETDPDKQKKLFSDWIEEAEESDIPAFAKCADTYRNRFTPITNSFFCPYTNGFTEGCNNRIKVLKRNAYGVRNFSRFRNRILFMFSGKSGTEA